MNQQLQTAAQVSTQTWQVSCKAKVQTQHGHRHADTACLVVDSVHAGKQVQCNVWCRKQCVCVWCCVCCAVQGCQWTTLCQHRCYFKLQKVDINGRCATFHDVPKQWSGHCCPDGAEGRVLLSRQRASVVGGLAVFVNTSLYVVV